MNVKNEENAPSVSSGREEKIRKKIQTVIDALRRAARARSVVKFFEFDNCEGLLEAALKISRDLDSKMKMCVRWSASVSLFIALKADMNIVEQFTPHSGLETDHFIRLVNHAVATVSGELPSVPRPPLEDTATVAAATPMEDTVSPVIAEPEKTNLSPGPSMLHEVQNSEPGKQVFVGDVIGRDKIKKNYYEIHKQRFLDLSASGYKIRLRRNTIKRREVFFRVSGRIRRRHKREWRRKLCTWSTKSIISTL